MQLFLVNPPPSLQKTTKQRPIVASKEILTEDKTYLFVRCHSFYSFFLTLPLGIEHNFLTTQTPLSDYALGAS